MRTSGVMRTEGLLSKVQIRHKPDLSHIQRNLQKAYTNMDKTRGIQMGNFAKKTNKGDVVESYGASGMPALMLMFPAQL